MLLPEFNTLIGQNSYVRCHGKKRIDNSIVDIKSAAAHLDNGGQLGWWVRPGYIVVDIDEGKEEALAVVRALHLRTLIAQTPKGLHLYFKSRKEYPQRVGMVLPFGLRCDFRCANKGYVVLPFNDKKRKFNKCREIAELPPEFTPLLNCKESLLGMEEGDGRNSALFSHLMAYKNRGASDSEIESMAQLINKYIFRQPMPERELSALLASSKNYEARTEWENPYIIYNKEGKPAQINARAICDYFVNRGGLFVIGADCYQYGHGVYRESSIKVRNMMRSMVGVDKLITQPRITEVYRLLVDDIRIQRQAVELNANPRYINFENGVWDVEKRKLVKHDSAFLQTIQIPHRVKKFVPFTQTKLYKFFRLTKLSKEDVKMMLAYMAYCLTTDYGLKTFMVLVGQSNTGKSVLIRFVETLVGKVNTSALGMHELNMRFYPAQLYGKLLNSCADNKTLPLASIENLKKITGGDQIMHEQKGRDPFFFVPFAKLLFSFNQLPLQLEEKSNAFYKRMRILFMNNELFLNNEYVNDLCSDESVESVIPYLLSLLPLKEIPRSKMSETYVELLRQDSDSIHAFLVRECQKDPQKEVSKDVLYQAYADFCIAAGREAHKKHSFARAMRSYGFTEIRGKDRRYRWRGLTLQKGE